MENLVPAAKSALNVASLVKFLAGAIVVFWVIDFARSKSTAVDSFFSTLKFPTA